MLKKLLKFAFATTIVAAALIVFPLTAAADRLDTHEGMMAAYSPLVMAYTDKACTIPANHYLCPGDWYEEMSDMKYGTVNVWYPITVPVANDKTSIIFKNYWFHVNGSDGFKINADGGTGTFSYNIDPNKWYNCRSPSNQAIVKMPSAITYIDEHNDGHNYNMSKTFVSNNYGFVVSPADRNKHKRLYCNDKNHTPIMYASGIPADGNCVNNPTDYIDADWAWYRASQAWSTVNLHQGLNTVYFAGTDASANYKTSSTPFHYDSIPPIISANVDNSAGTVSISADDDKSPGYDGAGRPNFSGLAYYIYRISLNGGSSWGAWSAHMTAGTVVNPGAKNYAVEIKAYDNAGNYADKVVKPSGGVISDNIIPGQYRVNTDVITAVTVYNQTDADIYDCIVTFTVDGVTYQQKTIPVRSQDTNLVWFRWHTPSIPGYVYITATAADSGTLTFTDCFDPYIYPCDEVTPPNPLSTDRAPNGFSVYYSLRLPEKQTTTWGQWSYMNDTWYYTNYWAGLNATLNISPDSRCKTATQNGGIWTIKSGYGISQDVNTMITTTSPGDVTPVQRVASFYPEFDYGTYDRLMELVYGGMFDLSANKYSMYKSRVHFTPAWYPDGNYTVSAYAFDAWTPGGMLSYYADDTVNIKGSVFDDWHSGPKWSSK